MSDYSINKIQPDSQVDGLNNYEDLVPEAEMVHAEFRGIKIATGTNGATDVPGTSFTDATYNSFATQHIGKFLYIKSGADSGNYYRIKSITSTSVVVLETAMTGSQSGLSWDMLNEPSVEDDINRAITQLRNIIDTANDWFDPMPRGFDAANTDGANTKNEKMSLKVLADDWYGSKTKIIDIEDDNSGNGYSRGAGDVGQLIYTSHGYADPADRRGLIVQKSVANTGSYYDEAALGAIEMGKHKVMLISMDPNNQLGDEFFGSNGTLVYGLLEDGADHEPSGLGEGTSIYVKFYNNIAGVPTAYTWTANDPDKIRIMLPFRKRRRDINEYEDRLHFKNGVLGDAELAMDMEEVRDALGLVDGEGSGDWDWTNTAAFYPLDGDPATAEQAINDINDAIGDRQYTEENVVTDGETITQSIDELDKAISAGSLKSKILERVSSLIFKGTNHTVPFNLGSGYNGGAGVTTYKVDSGNWGRYMDIFVGGAKIVPWNGTNPLTGQYKEINNTTVQFLFNVRRGQIIEYKIYDDA